MPARSGIVSAAAIVVTTAAADEGFGATPLPIQRRLLRVYVRLANCPAVSGAKPLRGDLQGSCRVRTGDYRVVFNVESDPATGEVVVFVWRIGYRGDVYD